MDPTATPLLDELVSALAAAREEICRIRAQGTEAEPDPSVLEMTQAAIQRFELERDRSDLDAATLPTKLVIVVEEGAITNLLTDSAQPVEIAIIDYDVDDDWHGENMVSVPQTGGHPDALAIGLILKPSHAPERTAQLHRAVFRASCAAHNTTEH